LLYLVHAYLKTPASLYLLTPLTEDALSPLLPPWLHDARDASEAQRNIAGVAN
jgi:hypothetical protein